MNKQSETFLESITILLWTVLKCTKLLHVPLFIGRLFKNGTKCPPITEDILLQSATTLADRIRRKEVSSEDLVTTYINRIKEVNPIINAVLQDRFEGAIKDAKLVDSMLKTGKHTEEFLKIRYPLLGLPVTIKGSIAVAGMTHNSGSTSRNVTADKDAVIVGLLKKYGAIPLLVSNIPEFCMNWETSNKLIGTTGNPYDTSKTVGGSSGGEAALLGAAASLIGVGSDIAGSLRLPAHFCGIWGHKPSPGAVSNVGHYPDCTNKEKWEQVFTLGPLARYSEDLKLLLRCIAEPEKKQLLLLEKPVNVRTLKVYFVKNWGSTIMRQPTLEIKNAVDKVVKHFEEITNNKASKLNLNNLNNSSLLAAIDLLTTDGIKLYENAYKEFFLYLTYQSKYAFTTVGYGLLKKLIDALPEGHKLCVKKLLNQLREELIELLGDNGVLVCPTYPSEAHSHGDIYTHLSDGGYMTVFNAVGFPVTNCPVTFSKSGLPIGVQVAAAPYCDRLTLAVAKEIEKTFGGWKAPS